MFFEELPYWMILKSAKVVSKLHVFQLDMSVQTSQIISQLVNNVRNTFCLIQFIITFWRQRTRLIFHGSTVLIDIIICKVVSKLHVLQRDMSVQTSQNISQLVNKVRNTLCHIKYNSFRHVEGKVPDLFFKELLYWMIFKPAKVVSVSQ